MQARNPPEQESSPLSCGQSAPQILSSLVYGKKHSCTAYILGPGRKSKERVDLTIPISVDIKEGGHVKETAYFGDISSKTNIS